LLVDAGWIDIRKLVIIDRDWWLSRVAGGDSAVTMRHMAAAVAAKGDDGKFYWSRVTFKQDKTIAGYAALEIRNTGKKNPIAENNIGK